jgi:hypothetical protein
MIPALLALAVAAAPPAAAAGFVDAVERLPLPRVTGPVSLRVLPLEGRIEVDAPRGAAALERTLRAISRLLCPAVEARPGGVTLRCRTTRIAASVVRPGGALALELRETSGIPWEGDVAMPLVFHDPALLGLGGCGEGPPAARAECLLRDGRAEAALDLLGAAAGDPPIRGGDHARLRLGDLALAAGDPVAASARWATVRAEPWARLAEVRQCELSAACVGDRGADLYDAAGLPASFARELALRAARARAFRGEPVAAAAALADQWTPTGACAGAAPLCRRLMLTALRRPGDRREEALALYVTGVRSDDGPLALELAGAASRLAAEAGAPGFAAALLSASAGRVDAADLPAHLLGAAELYVEAGDLVRAAVVLDFARTRLAPDALRGPRWAAVARATARRPAPPQRAAEPPAPELPRARAAIARAQALSGDAP